MLEDDTYFITEVRFPDSRLQRTAGTLSEWGGTGAVPGQRGWLRSWVTGWTHRLEVDARGLATPEPTAGVGRLAEAVVDVLLERRPVEQMRRWLSRDVAGLLTAPGTRRGPARFAARSMIRSVRLHQPAAGIVETTVVVQDGTRVRAVALRFEQAVPSAPVSAQGRCGFDWLCTALQFN